MSYTHALRISRVYRKTLSRVPSSTNIRSTCLISLLLFLGIIISIVAPYSFV